MVPAEGLLGAARLAPAGPPSKTPAFNFAWRRKLPNPFFFLSGVRTEDVKRWKPGEVFRNFCGGLPAEGLLGAARLAPSGPPSKTPAFNFA
jgi:hypothetical protein